MALAFLIGCGAPLPPKAPASSGTQAYRLSIGPRDVPLPATLLVPAGAKRAPAVVLVQGSGPHDQDSTIGPNKPLRDLAEGLAARGVVVLRYDKRTAVYGAWLAAKRTFTVQDEVIDDALIAVRVLRAVPEVDPRRIYVIGHSFGATLAPRIARDDGGLAGLVLLSAAARPLGELVLEQADYLERIQGSNAAFETLRQDARRTLDPSLTAESPGPILGAPVSYWLDLRSYNPIETARGLSLPMLVIHGGRDYQTPERDFAMWRAGLASRGGVTFCEYPALNHLLMAGTGPSAPDEYMTPGHVDPAVIEEIARFVTERR